MRRRVRDIYAICDEVSPFASAEAWDNSGLNLGSLESAYNDIIIALEATREIALNAPKHSLIITHHPLFFAPLKQFEITSYPCNIAEILIAKSCSLLSLHTNFDKSHLNAYLAHNVLKWQNLSQNDFIISGQIAPISLHHLAQYVKTQLNAPFVRYTHGWDLRGDFIESNDSNDSKAFAESADSKHSNDASENLIDFVSIVCGSGCSLLSALKHKRNHCFISADIKHHDAMSARSMGISLIDMGHYESEKYFVKIMESILQNAGYNAIIADCKNPFYLA